MTDQPSLYNRYMVEIIAKDRLARERRELFDVLVRFNVRTVQLRKLDCGVPAGSILAVDAGQTGQSISTSGWSDGHA